MNRNTNGFLLLALALSIGAISVPTEKSGSPPPKPQEASKPVAVELQALKEQLSNDYKEDLCYALIALPAEAPASLAQPCVLEDQLVRPDLDIIIALVPDPKHTRLTLLFDRQIDAIMQGAQGAGFTFSTAYLPWEAQEYSPPSDPVLRYTGKKMEDFREDNPGYLTFRMETTDLKYSKVHKNLLVFLIGERPTSGPNQPQFASALRMLRMHTNSKSLGVLRIMGPCFSGSLAVLERMLAPEANSMAGLQVISGIVQGQIQGDVFEKWMRNSAKGRTFNFLRFNENSNYLLDLVLKKYLEVKERGAYVAVLAEDETSYGATRQIQPTLKNEPYPNLVNLSFPREISQLRTAYQKKVIEQPQAQNARRAPRSTLELSLEQSGSDDDSVASFSPQTPLSQEAVMLGLIAALRSHHIQTVFIRATDPLDIIFLAEYIRTAYPEAQVITFTNDWLIAHEASNPKLRALLSVTTYPLAAKWQDSVASPNRDHIHRVPPSRESAAVFNAAVEMFNEIVHAPDAEKHPNQDVNVPVSPDLFEYGCPNDLKDGCPSGENGTHPPAVIEALGRQGYWPIALLSDTHEHGNDKRHSTLPLWKATFEAEPYRVPPLPLSWQVFILISFVAPFIYIVLLFVPRYTTLQSVLALKFSPDLIGRFGVAPFFLMALLITAEQVLCVLPFIFLWRLHHPFWMACSFALSFVIIALLARDLWERSLELKRQGKRIPIYVIYLTVAGIISAAALVAVWYFSRSSDITKYAYWHFFFDRYINLFSGLSPVLPFVALLVAMVWWLHHCITGMSVLGTLRPHLPDSHYGSDIASKADCASFTEFAYLHDSLAEGKGNLLELLPWVPIIEIPIVIGISIFLFLAWGSHPLLSVEGDWYNWAFLVLFIAANAVICFELGRLWLMWQQFQNFLVSLDNSLLRRGFSNLRGYRWDPLWSFGSELNDLWKLLTRMYESLSCVQRRASRELTRPARYLLDIQGG